MNLGHPGSPDRETLLRAFVDAGGQSVRSFQTNGTVIFTADDPAATAQRARELVSDRYDDSVLVRSAARVAQIAATFPATDTASDHYREMIVFFDYPSSQADPVPEMFEEGLVRVLRVEQDVAFGLVWKPKDTAGNMTALVERRLGAIGTSRTLGTVQRLSRQLFT